MDKQMQWMVGGIFSLLIVATVIGQLLYRRARTDSAKATIANANARTYAWWFMVVIFLGALWMGFLGAVILFGLISFLALREFVTLTPTRAGDHRSLFWAFFIITPLQYVLVAIQWYDLFIILIPVYAFLFLPVRSAVDGDCERFLERAAKIQWAMMVCVYCVSHAPALLSLQVPGYQGENAKLLLYLIVIVQLSDVFQYIWGKSIGRHKVAPLVSPNKTWEGLIGGVATATLVGALLWRITPFTPLQSAGMALGICVMGFAGGLVMSAIKRDRNVKDFGTLIHGHGGVLDRIDSICFAAPVFFHLTRHYFT